MTLKVTGPTGDLIDEVELKDGVLAYRTGTAREIFETMRGRMEKGLADADLYALMDGWTNAYITVTEVP